MSTSAMNAAASKLIRAATGTDDLDTTVTVDLMRGLEDLFAGNTVSTSGTALGGASIVEPGIERLDARVSVEMSTYAATAGDATRVSGTSMAAGHGAAMGGDVGDPHYHARRNPGARHRPWSARFNNCPCSAGLHSLRHFV